MKPDDMSVNGVKLQAASEAGRKDLRILLLLPARAQRSEKASGAT